MERSTAKGNLLYLVNSFLPFNVLTPTQNHMMVREVFLPPIGNAYIPDRRAVSDA